MGEVPKDVGEKDQKRQETADPEEGALQMNPELGEKEEAERRSQEEKEQGDLVL